MALKGTATIELTDADGRKEIYKHDNLVTDAPADLCKSIRGDYATILKYMKNGDSYMQALFGGILLFSDSLDDNKSKYMIPNAKVVGYASQDAYAGLDTARGSFNASESGVQEDGKSYKFVWDFTTAQANGSIKALGLVPNMMGQIGLSADAVSSESKIFTIQNRDAAPFDTSGYMLENNGSTAGVSNYNYILVAVKDDIGYAVDLGNVKLDRNTSSQTNAITKNGGILNIHRFKMSMQSVGVHGTVGKAVYLDKKDVQLPTEFTSKLASGTDRYLVAFNYIPSSNKIIVFPKWLPAGYGAGQVVKYVEISLPDLKVTSKEVTNTTGGTLTQLGTEGSYGEQLSLWIGSKYTLMRSMVGANSDIKLFAIKNADSTDVKEIKLPNEVEFKLESNQYIQMLFQSDDTCAIYLNNGNLKRPAVFIDLANGIVLKTNVQYMSCSNDISYSEKIVAIATGNYLTCIPVMNPFVLCTKNNLPSAVTKTSSQTMKITYTLTESEGA